MVKNQRPDGCGLAMHPVYDLGRVSNVNEPQTSHLQTTVEEIT